MAAEIEKILEQEGRPAPVRPPSSFGAPGSLAERVRLDPPLPGVRRFYNTAFKMPERPRHGD